MITQAQERAAAFIDLIGRASIPIAIAAIVAALYLIGEHDLRMNQPAPNHPSMYMHPQYSGYTDDACVQSVNHP